MVPELRGGAAKNKRLLFYGGGVGGRKETRRSARGMVGVGC